MDISDSLVVRFSYKWEKPNTKISISRCLTTNGNIHAVDIVCTDEALSGFWI